jgi:hypothetical protein
MYGIAAPAPICPEPSSGTTEDPASCQTVQAPVSPGQRLVPDTALIDRQVSVGSDGELRLTYRELTKLIEDAVKNLMENC